MKSPASLLPIVMRSPAILLFSVCASLPAVAQLAVYDPANHSQNILQAVRALQELDNQVDQLAHEIDMIEKMSRDLETLPTDIAHAIILDRIARIEELLKRAEGIGYEVDEIEREYDQTYPETYGDIPPSSSVLVEDARTRWIQSRDAHKHVLLVAAETRSANAADAEALSDLIADSQEAVGNLQALQASNQIEALTAGQLIQIEALIAAHSRALSLDEARRLAESERGQARLKTFLGD